MEIFINGGRNLTFDSLHPGVITISYKKQYCTTNLLLLQKIKQTIPTILQIRTRTALMMKAKPLPKLSGSSASVSGDGVAVSGSTVTISKAGTYVISGESDEFKSKVEAGDSDDVTSS